uniref:Uncharacterized protein n=1 Tax=Arundo donax TaxID=35708 RepID=A0A0A9HPJ7_ARUDO
MIYKQLQKAADTQRALAAIYFQEPHIGLVWMAVQPSEKQPSGSASLESYCGFCRLTLTLARPNAQLQGTTFLLLLKLHEIRCQLAEATRRTAGKTGNT